MGTDLQNVAVLHVQDAVGIADRQQSVRDDETRAPLHDMLHSLCDEQFRLGVDLRGGFVENQNIRIGQYDACNGKQLLLPADSAEFSSEITVS